MTENQLAMRRLKDETQAAWDLLTRVRKGRDVSTVDKLLDEGMTAVQIATFLDTGPRPENN